LSIAVWDNTVLPAIQHKLKHPAVAVGRQAYTRFAYPGGTEG